MHFRYFDRLIQISSEIFESWILVCSQLLLFRVQRLRSNWDKFRNFMLESFSIVAAFWDPAAGLFRIPATLWSYLLLRGIRDSLSLSLSLIRFLILPPARSLQSWKAISGSCIIFIASANIGRVLLSRLAGGGSLEQRFSIQSEFCVKLLNKGKHAWVDEELLN